MIHAILSTELFWTAFVWLFALILLGIIMFGMWREHDHFRRLLGDAHQDKHHLLAILYRRQLQLWMAVALLVTVLGANDLRHAYLQIPPEIFSTTASIPVSLPVVPKESRKQAAIAGISSPLPFSDIPEFNEIDSKEQVYIDLLKQRYEAWLVTYYYLQKCGKTSAGDFELIRSGLAKELTRVHADDTIKDNILTAASGSYKEMYYDIPCDKVYLAASKSSYDVNMQQLRTLLAGKDGPKAPQSAGSKADSKR